MGFPLRFLSSLLLCLLALLLHRATVTSGCFSMEREALLDFKAGIHDTHNRLSSWTGHHCCTWKGVTCDTTTGHVVMLDLRNTNITDDWALRGERMNSSLLALSHLEHLDLSFNDFSGIRMPEFIGSFKKLRYLNLSSTYFMGGIPARLGNLSSLYVLDLSDALDFASHVDNLDWLSHLTSLKHLDLSWLKLTGAPDWFSSVNMLPSLQVLSMSYVGLDTIPASVVHVNFTSSLTVLHLSFNNFNSTLPKWLGNITSLTHLDLYFAGLYGVIPDAIGDLGSLTFLNLGDNQLEGIVPRSMVDLRRLKELHMQGNRLTGNLSDLLEQMTNLIILDLGSNLFNGSMPSSVGKFSNLTELNLAGNSVGGVLSEVHFENLTRLQVLDLSDNLITISVGQSWVPPFQLRLLDLTNCQLGPQFPEWLQFQTQMTTLYLADCKIAGTMPAWFWNISSSTITDLDLSNNQIGGKLPSSFKFTKLERLNLDSNRFEGPLPTMPPSTLDALSLSNNSFTGQLPIWPHVHSVALSDNMLDGGLSSSICQWTFLEYLDLSNNKLLGEIPYCLGESLQNLCYLDLGNNQIGGKLPSSFKFTKLEMLYLYSNRFEGPLPTMLPSTLDALSLSNNSFTGQLLIWPHVKFVFISDNMLDGGLSSSICQWTCLEYLDLSNNKLLGEIPYCPEESLQNLRFLNLGNNHFSGEIPHTIGFLSELQLLQLKNNSFSGEVPLSLKNCTNLWFLDLAQNNLVGSITLWMGENLRRQLVVLRLRSNMFSGVIPWQLARFKRLQILDLANNNLSGSIPQNIGNLNTMRSTSQYNDFCYDELDVFTKGQDLHYLQCSIKLMKSMDLSNNSLTGEIPKGIGDLAGLKNLNLSRNHLQGKIPWEIGGMKSLESLDLSINDLSGSIPESLSVLYSLSYLNLSYNNLSGRIPTGHQLQTLNDPSIYMGNADLCGPPTSKSCFNNKITQNIIQEYKKEIPEWLWFYISMVLGYVIGFWTFYGILFLKDAWRHTYFHTIDHMYDWLWVK
ncbi:receptor-like protein 36 [Musa acuminata AAA Group]|uniref:receptor-like protein 36 n=1 Tax=Musa acuminata AAA Group TaxID=214697 RepID=UPI0031E375C0